MTDCIGLSISQTQLTHLETSSAYVTEWHRVPTLDPTFRSRWSIRLKRNEHAVSRPATLIDLQSLSCCRVTKWLTLSSFAVSTNQLWKCSKMPSPIMSMASVFLGNMLTFSLPAVELVTSSEEHLQASAWHYTSGLPNKHCTEDCLVSYVDLECACLMGIPIWLIVQVLFACIHVDNTFLLCLPHHLTPSTQKFQQKGSESHIDGRLHLDATGVQHGAKLHEDATFDKEINLHHKSRHESFAAMQAQTLEIEMTVMQANMLSAYQAHQALQHPSKISILSLLGSDYEVPCAEANHSDTTYNKSLRRGCRAVLIAMQKTLYMEDREICGPIIHCDPATLPQDLNVRLYHIRHTCKSHGNPCTSYGESLKV